MSYHPRKAVRRSIRLRGYDYSQEGAYFVTICAKNRECLFGDVAGRRMELNEPGVMVTKAFKQLDQRFPNVRSDVCVVMPNHVHGIIWIVGALLVGALDNANPIGATTRVAPTLGDIVGGFKSITTDEYILGIKMLGWAPFTDKLWQRNYYEHIIRNEKTLTAIRDYIHMNPSNWASDPENPFSGSEPKGMSEDPLLV